jgi:hypothetical protein
VTNSKPHEQKLHKEEEEEEGRIFIAFHNLIKNRQVGHCTFRTQSWKFYSPLAQQQCEIVCCFDDDDLTYK